MNRTLTIAWTTLDTEKAAHTLAHQLLGTKLVACIQVEGPIRSFYPWKGKIENELEYRLVLKFPSDHLDPVREAVHSLHPYETPQWIAVEASDVGTPYAQWAFTETKAH